MVTVAIVCGAVGIAGIPIAIRMGRKERYRQELAEQFQYRRYFKTLKGEEHGK